MNKKKLEKIIKERKIINHRLHHLLYSTKFPNKKKLNLSHTTLVSRKYCHLSECGDCLKIFFIKTKREKKILFDADACSVSTLSTDLLCQLINENLLSIDHNKKYVEKIVKKYQTFLNQSNKKETNKDNEFILFRQTSPHLREWKLIFNFVKKSKRKKCMSLPINVLLNEKIILSQQINVNTD